MPECARLTLGSGTGHLLAHRAGPNRAFATRPVIVDDGVGSRDTGRASRRLVPPPRRLASLSLLILATAGGASWVVHELGQEERDRHGIQEKVWEIERKLRTHDAGLWLLPEGELPDGHKHATGAAGHEGLRADIERLAHLENLRLVVREIGISGDAAFADYGIEATGSRRGDPEPPPGGRFSFRRAGDRWLLSANRFDEMAAGR